MSSFLPLCNHCLFSIEDKQGFLLSCGHFACLGCCRGRQPSTCPHCGAHARAAVLEHPPAEVRDYLQNPLTQLKAANDVVMFQLDHFRAAANQANKALHELRLVHSQEVARREAAEDDAQAWRRRAEAAESANARGGQGGRRDGAGTGREGSSLVGASAFGGRRGGALTTSDQGDPGCRDGSRQSFTGGSKGQRRSAAAAGTSTSTAYSSHHFKRRSDGGGSGGGGSGGDSDGGGGRQNSSEEQRVLAGRTAPTLNRPRSPSPVDRSTQPRSRPQAAAARGQHHHQEQQFRRSSSAGAGENGRIPSDSFAGPPPPARPLRLVGDRRSRTPDTSRQAASGHCSAPPNTASPGRFQSTSGMQQPQQQQQHQQRQRRHLGEEEVPASATQRPQTPGRPVRPAWQNGSGDGGGAGRAGAGKAPASSTGALSERRTDVAARNERQASSHFTQQMHHSQQRRPQRPTASQEGSSTGGGGGGGSREFPSPSPPAITPRNAQGGTSAPAGSSRPLSARLGSGQSAVPTSPSPRSPLLAVRPGAPKRPSSGSLPAPKRPGLAQGGGGGSRGGAGGTPQRRAGTPIPTLRASSPSPPIRSAQLPFSPRSTQRPGSSQRPRSSNGGHGGGSGTGRFGDGHGRPASSVPSSLEAAGLFGRRPHANGGAR